MTDCNLDYDIMFSILVNTDYETLVNVCKTCTKYSEICNDYYFWRQKLLKDYNIDSYIEYDKLDMNIINQHNIIRSEYAKILYRKIEIPKLILNKAMHNNKYYYKLIADTFGKGYYLPIQEDLSPTGDYEEKLVDFVIICKYKSTIEDFEDNYWINVGCYIENKWLVYDVVVEPHSDKPIAIDDNYKKSIFSDKNFYNNINLYGYILNYNNSKIDCYLMNIPDFVNLTINY